MISIVLDLVYGDCGKGRIVDYLADKYDMIARFNGGANSGHVVYYNDKKYTLHLIPSGVFHNKKCYIGNGVVIDPIALKEEIETLENDFPIYKLLTISKYTHLITPEHILEDKAKNSKIGTTGRGIGPAYMSKVQRTGVRICDINDDFLNIYKEKNPEYYSALKFIEKLDIIDDTVLYLLNSVHKNMNILAEGAQGTLLDIDHGTYPYVSSSNSTVGGVITGLGISPKQIDNIYGIFKAYSTRVGNGAFVTEITDEISDKIRQNGNEYGATTGRPRRCGWLDIVALKYACMINGVTELIMTKADVLNDFDEIKVCIGYDVDGKITYLFDKQYYDTAQPIYKSFKGWNTLTNKEPLEKYIKFIESETEIKITIVSTGKERDNLYIR